MAKRLTRKTVAEERALARLEGGGPSGVHGSRRAQERAPHHEGVWLFVQPHVVEARVVILAVVVRPKILHIRLPAIAGRAPDDAWTRGILGQQPLDIPHHLLAL